MSGKRSLGLAAVAAAPIVLMAGCASSAPNRATELGSCAMVGRLLGAPPGDQAVWIKEIMDAPESGNGALDTAMRHLAAGLDTGDAVKANGAESRVRTVCDALGLWRAYH
jgi:hypothetical protein